MQQYHTAIRIRKISKKAKKLKYQVSSKDTKQCKLTGGNAKWWRHFGKQFDSFLHSQTEIYHVTQLSHSKCNTLIFTKNMYMNVCSSFIYNHQEYKTIHLLLD